jgi:ferrous iron transport protein B
MRLSELRTGESGVIVKILGHGAFRKRVMEMGFVRGRRVSMMLQAPLNDPIKYSIMDYEVSLRRAEARLIEIEPVDSESDIQLIKGSGVSTEDSSRESTFEHRSHTINIALVGNPNCGKTTLFNIVSGAKEHVGNYSGVTVDAKSGTLNYNGYHFNVIDLPGTYSLASFSPERV